MYKSKNNSPERNSKMSEKELRKLEERRAKEDFLMSYGPVSICQFELKKIEVNIDGISSPVECPQPPLLYDLGDPELFKVYRRPGEGSKPIFANVLVNQPPDFRRVSIRNSRSPEILSASEIIRSTRQPKSPPHQSSHHHRDLSRSRHRSISRSRSSRSRTPHKSSSSHHRYRRSSPEIVVHKTSSEYKPSRSGSIHRRSPQPPESNKYDRSPKRRRSRESSERNPSRRANSSSRQTSPRRYSPNRKYSPSRSSRRPSPSNRREYERDRYRGHHSEKERNYSSRRSPDRRSSPRRHHSPSRNEMPVMMMPIPPEYWMSLAHTAGPMFRPRLPPGFMPRPIRQPCIPGVYIPRQQHYHQQQNQQAKKQIDRPAPSSTITSAQPSSTVTTSVEKQ